MGQNEEELEKAFAKLKHLLSDLKYGSVTLIVQDGIIIQIDKHMKERLR